MRCSVRSKGVLLLTVLLVHTALGSPVVKRDVRLLLGDDGVANAVADPRVSLLDADVFGGDVHENGQRDKRTLLKLKALGLGLAAKTIGTGVKAVGAGVKTVAVAGVKKVGGVALKVATTVGVKVAKAAITIGIAKLLLHLVFGTRLLGNVGSGKGILSSSNLGSLSSSSGSSSSSSGGSSSSSGGAGAGDTAASYDGGETTEGSAGDSETGEDLPEIDPQKVSLQIPSEIVAAGFNVVNRGAPVFGEIIQRTAERLVNVGASLKPLFASSFGFGGAGANYKRETGNDSESPLEQENEASSNLLVTAEAPSQFKRSYDPSENSPPSQSELQREQNEEDKEKLRNILLARKVIAKLLEKQVEKELEVQNAHIKKETGLGVDVSENNDETKVINLAVIPDDQQVEQISASKSSDESSTLVSDAPQADVKNSPSADQINASASQNNLSNLQSDQAFQSSPTIVQSNIPAFKRMPNIFESSPSAFQNSPSADQINASASKNKLSDLQSDQAFQSSQTIVQSNIPAFERMPNIFESRPSAFQSSQPNQPFEAAASVRQSNPSSFQSSPALQNSPSAFQSDSSFQNNPSILPSPPSNNPYYHQQYRDYNPHVKRQAPQYDYYQYQPNQNIPRYRPQYNNQYVQNGYRSYGF